MPRRLTPLVTGECYHVYNRGVARQPVFVTKRDYERFLLTLAYYRFLDPPMRLAYFLELGHDKRARLMQDLTVSCKRVVALMSFVLMPNHVHLLLRQVVDKGISLFMGRLMNSYTKYFNTKHDRVGPAFQGAFKAVHVETDAQLLHLSRYIHLNPLMGHVASASTWLAYPWSSLTDFRRGTSVLLELEPILSHFRSPKMYERFVRDRADAANAFVRIRHLTLEKGKNPDVLYL